MLQDAVPAVPGIPTVSTAPTSLKLRGSVAALSTSFLSAHHVVPDKHSGMSKVATSINGAPVPADLLPLQNTIIILDAIQEDGNRLVVSQGIRKAHTRVGIHYHPHGGHTCVLSGEITDYAEGDNPVVCKPGSCYLMQNTHIDVGYQPR